MIINLSGADKFHKRQLSESAAFSIPLPFTPESGSIDYLATPTVTTPSDCLSETIEGDELADKPNEHNDDRYIVHVHGCVHVTVYIHVHVN